MDIYCCLFLCVLEVFRGNWTHQTQCKTPLWSGARRRRRRCTWAGRTTCTQTCPWRDPLAWWPDRKKRDWWTVTKDSFFLSILQSFSSRSHWRFVWSSDSLIEGGKNKVVCEADTWLAVFSGISPLCDITKDSNKPSRTKAEGEKLVKTWTWEKLAAEVVWQGGDTFI